MDSTIYLVTGASGHLGSTLVKDLLDLKKRVRIFALPNEKNDIEDLEVFHGDITHLESLDSAFIHSPHEHLIVLHCAGYISIASKPDPKVERVNVLGTQNILDCCFKYHVQKLVYVCSVHAIVEPQIDCLIDEHQPIDPSRVHGAYAQSKAKACLLVDHAIENGLNASVVFPSGLCGPNDQGMGKMNGLILRYAQHKLPFITEGAYDFVDVRDVSKAILHCATRTSHHSHYILSNELIKVSDLFSYLKSELKRHFKPPVIATPLLKPMAIVIERIDTWLKRPSLITPYALYTLHSKAHFSYERAKEDLDYVPRSIQESLHDQVLYLKETHRMR